MYLMCSSNHMHPIRSYTAFIAELALQVFPSWALFSSWLLMLAYRYISHRQELHLQPADYRSAALLIELRWQWGKRRGGTCTHTLQLMRLTTIYWDTLRYYLKYRLSRSLSTKRGKDKKWFEFHFEILDVQLHPLN